MVEARSFTIYTDHKPITYAFQKKNTESSPRQIRHLDFISQFTTDIRHIAGTENVVADALSRIETLETSTDFQALTVVQQQDEELERFRTGNTGLQFKLVQIPGCDVSVLYAVSTRTARPI